MNILVDYLTFTIKEYPLKKFLNEINFLSVPYTNGGGGFGIYEHSVHFAGIHVFFNGSYNLECSDMFTISMSGKGCRSFESLHDNNLNWLDFISKYMRIENKAVLTIYKYDNFITHMGGLDKAIEVINFMRVKRTIKRLFNISTPLMTL